MARTIAKVPVESRATDYISLGVMSKSFPAEAIEGVLARTGRASLCIMARGVAHQLGHGQKASLLITRIATLTFALALGLVNMPCSGAQDADTSGSPQFAVASIRLVPPNRQGYTSISPYGQPLFIARNIFMTLLIELAYNVDETSIRDLPRREN